MTSGDDADEAHRGWDSDFVRFSSTPSSAIVARLRRFVNDASNEQLRAWDDSVPRLQAEAYEVREVNEAAAQYTAILEYQLPLESRRADAIFLLRESVVVIELKGKARPSDADIDQAHAYARDLRCYHAECAERDVYPLLVPTRAIGDFGIVRGVRICGPDVLDEVVNEYDLRRQREPVDPSRFLSNDAYRPLPTLVTAARELFLRGTLRRIKRAAAATDGAADAISTIVHEAARTRSRRLVLLTGVPGAGKTLVGLRLVHSHIIDDLVVPRAEGNATSPAVFLSGNGPLVEVLQYELRDAGGGGKTFVRGVKDYVRPTRVRTACRQSTCWSMTRRSARTTRQWWRTSIRSLQARRAPNPNCSSNSPSASHIGASLWRSSVPGRKSIPEKKAASSNGPLQSAMLGSRIAGASMVLRRSAKPLQSFVIKAPPR